MAYVGQRGVLINISYSEVLQSNFGYLDAFFSPLLHMEGDGTIIGDSTAFFQWTHTVHNHHTISYFMPFKFYASCNSIQ